MRKKLFQQFSIVASFNFTLINWFPQFIVISFQCEKNAQRRTSRNCKKKNWLHLWWSLSDCCRHAESINGTKQFTQHKNRIARTYNGATSTLGSWGHEFLSSSFSYPYRIWLLSTVIGQRRQWVIGHIKFSDVRFGLHQSGDRKGNKREPIRTNVRNTRSWTIWTLYGMHIVQCTCTCTVRTVH